MKTAATSLWVEAESSRAFPSISKVTCRRSVPAVSATTQMLLSRGIGIMLRRNGSGIVGGLGV